MTNLLTYGMDVKNSFLQCQGWHSDTYGHFEPVDVDGKSANLGMQQRCAWFRKDYSLNNDWREEGLTLTGRLMHEFMGVDKCMPPETKIEFKLEKSRDEFYLMVGNTNEAVPKEDTEEYMFEISNCCMYVQTGTLNYVLHDEILRRWPKEDIVYFFRRFDMLDIRLGENCSGLVTERLWTQSINPLRIYAVIVDYTSHSPGSRKTNPVNRIF
jgi:hypothetical protein